MISALAFGSMRGPGQSGAIWTKPALYLVPVAGVVALAVFFGRAEAVNRLVGMYGAGDEARISKLPEVLQIARDFFPFGTGMGSFDPVFRGYETVQDLDLTYFNHAHNDLAELALTGGLPALLILIAFITWAMRSAAGALSMAHAEFQRLGAVIVALILFASLVDYPLRTPLLSAIFTLAVVWLRAPETAGQGR
jgi:O-antigen ligase